MKLVAIEQSDDAKPISKQLAKIQARQAVLLTAAISRSDG